jgi:hypothetical protein
MLAASAWAAALARDLRECEAESCSCSIPLGSVLQVSGGFLPNAAAPAVVSARVYAGDEAVRAIDLIF